MTPLVIDLSAYRSDGCRVFSGRVRGRLVRKATGLDAADTENCPVVVRIPPDAYSVSHSFVDSFLGPSLLRRGARFLEEFRFVGPGAVVKQIYIDLRITPKGT